jgi:site-specific recombinase XerD
MMMTAYAAGVRVGELVNLQVADIHSQRMLIRVQGKGFKDRYTLLSPRLLEELRGYWREYRPQVWLFPNRKGNGPICIGSVQKAFESLKSRAGVQHGHGIHCLRHSFATHLLEAGVDLLTIQKLLAHRSLSTTMKYLHITSQHLDGVKSPFDLLRLPSRDDLRE